QFPLELVEGLFRATGLGNRKRFAFVAEEEIRLCKRSVERLAEDLRNECIRAGNRDLRTVFLGELDRFANRSLPGFGIREDVSFDEEPFGVLYPPFFHVPRGQMT